MVQMMILFSILSFSRNWGFSLVMTLIIPKYAKYWFSKFNNSLIFQADILNVRYRTKMYENEQKLRNLID